MVSTRGMTEQSIYDFRFAIFDLFLSEATRGQAATL
jgi:hypothetical protein